MTATGRAVLLQQTLARFLEDTFRVLEDVLSDADKASLPPKASGGIPSSPAPLIMASDAVASIELPWTRTRLLFSASWPTEAHRSARSTPHAPVSVALCGEVESLLCFDRDTDDSLHGCVASAAEGVLRGTPADSSTLAQAPLVPIRAGVNFHGTDRFSVRRQLGAGGMGVVYEVHDHVRDEVVALKTLLRAVAGDIYRLKREFRSLTDIAHTNLVSLYELVVDGTTCFFTMELVQGVNFVEYVRGSAAAGRRSMPSGSGMPSGSLSRALARCTNKASSIETSSRPTSW